MACLAGYVPVSELFVGHLNVGRIISTTISDLVT